MPPSLLIVTILLIAMPYVVLYDPVCPALRPYEINHYFAPETMIGSVIHKKFTEFFLSNGQHIWSEAKATLSGDCAIRSIAFGGV